MAGELKSLVSDLTNAVNRKQFDTANDLLSRAKRTLLLQNALIPTPSTSPELIILAREILELGALAAIRQTDAPSFTRYYQQLQPFYDLERDATSAKKVDPKNSQRSKITGLYLLLLLSSGDSTSFHTVLEGLVEEASLNGKSVEDDPFIKYPVDLERNLMEGSYDKVWRETNSERVPSEDFALFSNVRLSFLDLFETSCARGNGKLIGIIGPRRNHPQRNCRLLREGLPIPSDIQR
jgi:26S proteasome regulatory subunit N12